MQLGHTISTEEISNLVDRFYERVQLDPQIGPVFNEAIEDWPAHLALLKNFWASVLLGAGLYRGNPLATHLKLPLEPAHFQRWLELFAQTAKEVMAPEDAELIIRKSQQIARNFQAVIAYQREQDGV